MSDTPPPSAKGMAELAEETRGIVAAMRAELFGPDRLASILSEIGGEPAPGCPIAGTLLSLVKSGSTPSAPAMEALGASAPEFAKLLSNPSSC